MLVGHKRVLQYLRRAVADSNLAPSYLFTGIKGIGKFLAAQYFISAIMCINSRNGVPCGECINCKRIHSGNHPDVRILTLEDKKNSIGIEEIREGISSLQTCSYEGGYRFWIIDEAQRLTEEAQSALLKTLEEPSESLIIILIAHGEVGLLPTVTSRCRKFEFNPLSSNDISQFLVSKGVANEKARVVARISSGSLGRAWDFVNNENLWDNRVAIMEIMGSVIDFSLWQRLEAASTLEKLASSDRLQNEYFLEMISSFFRDALCLKVGVQSDLLINVDCMQSLQKVSQNMSEASLERTLEEALKAKDQIKRNVNIKFMWQNFLIAINN